MPASMGPQRLGKSWGSSQISILWDFNNWTKWRQSRIVLRNLQVWVGYGFLPSPDTAGHWQSAYGRGRSPVWHDISLAGLDDRLYDPYGVFVFRNEKPGRYYKKNPVSAELLRPGRRVIPNWLSAVLQMPIPTRLYPPYARRPAIAAKRMLWEASL